MLKICGNSLRSPLELIFNNCLANEIFLSDWKKDNIVPAYKKNDIQRLNNCRPISLLTICSKILEELISNEMFRFFIKNDLISQHQSGFKLRDSCINQLLSITHEIYHLMMKVLMPIVYFSTYLRSLTKYGIIFKLKQNSISGNLLNLLSNFLRNRKQKVVLNGQLLPGMKLMQEFLKDPY